MAGWVLWYALVAAVATAVVWVGSSILERASERLAVHYELPDIVTGALVVAIGSSFPELSTTVISTAIHGRFELGVSAVVGSAIFNILVIPGIAGLVGREQLTSNRDLVYKEAQFYMLAVSVLFITFAFAVIYNPVDGDSLDPHALYGEVTRQLVFVPLALYALYVFVQWQDTMDYVPEASTERIRPLREWLGLVFSLGLILVGVEGLVQAAIGLGDVLGTPSYLWGVTVVAAGTSVPDAFISVKAARNDRAVTALANVLGSNVFDLTVCIPIGVLIAGTVRIDFAVAAPMLSVLTFATLALFLMMRTQMRLTRIECVVLLAMYGLFLVWIAAESFQLVDLVPSLPPRENSPATGH